MSIAQNQHHQENTRLRKRDTKQIQRSMKERSRMMRGFDVEMNRRKNRKALSTLLLGIQDSGGKCAGVS